jgi:hypothetical protein
MRTFCVRAGSKGQKYTENFWMPVIAGKVYGGPTVGSSLRDL